MAEHLTDRLRRLAGVPKAAPAIGTRTRRAGPAARAPGRAAERIARLAPAQARTLTQRNITSTATRAPRDGYGLPGGNKLTVWVRSFPVLVWIDPGSYVGQVAPTWPNPPIYLPAGQAWSHAGPAAWVAFQDANVNQHALVDFNLYAEPPAIAGPPPLEGVNLG